MARSFNGTSDVITYGGAVLTATPLTIAGWFQVTSTGVIYGLTAIANNAGSSAINGWGLRTIGGGGLIAEAGDGTTSAAAQKTGISANTWFHGAGAFASNISRIAYLNGAASTTSTSTINPTGQNRTYLGARYVSALGSFLSGQAAEVAIWNVALSAQEIAALAAGVLPNRIRPLSLMAYWPLWGLQSPEPDLSGNGYSGTLTGTSQSNHAPVTPFTRKRPTVGALAGGGTGGALMYRRRPRVAPRYPAPAIGW